MSVAIAALRRAGAEDPAKIREAIAQTKDFPAATGRITFNELGEIYKAAQVQVVKNGKFTHFASIDDRQLLAPPSK
jgi:branched-chain amino acid transport system substrate-binding protein